VPCRVPERFFHCQRSPHLGFLRVVPRRNFGPALSKNFHEARKKLAAMTNAPANWHVRFFFPVTFDPEFDSPRDGSKLLVTVTIRTRARELLTGRRMNPERARPSGRGDRAEDGTVTIMSSAPPTSIPPAICNELPN